MILQKEFADRLVAPVGSEEYGWLTVVTSQRAEVELLDIVPKNMFYPQPEVDSIILKLKTLERKTVRGKGSSFFHTNDKVALYTAQQKVRQSAYTLH